MSLDFSHFNWTRYWGERDGAFHIDRYGFLDHSDFYKDSFEFADLREQPCLLLLGEPGIGKTFAVKKAAAQEIGNANSTSKTLFLDLRSYGSEDRLYRALFESDVVNAWRAGDHTLHLFLDSLDECLLRVDTVAGILVDEFSKPEFPRERLILRISCRTADVPPLLESELFRMWKREDKEGIYELCPLQQTDVVESANAVGLDGSAFLRSVIEKGVGTLAARPVTLKMLLNSFAEQGEFPKRPIELYEAGCRALCDEPNESRRGSTQLSSKLSPDESLIVAARIAAFTVLCNRAAIWTGMETGEQRPEDLLVREMVGGSEEYRGIQILVDDETIRTVLGSGLFTSRGANRQGWSHQTFAEFLAALYLNRRGFSLDGILALVTNAADAENKPPPQLAETLSWLASMREDVREYLLKTDPLLLLRSDAATFTDEFKTHLVDELLMLFSEGEVLNEIDLHSYYRRLNHSDIAAQLRPYIVDKECPPIVRRVATDIAQECEIGELQEELKDLILDEDEDLYLRTNAGYALWKIADTSTRNFLRQLALEGSTQDKDLELKGVALLSTWPDVITADEAFSAIQHPPDGFYGAYSMFLHRFISLLKDDDLPRALQWIRENYTSMAADFSLKRVMDEIVIRAEQHLRDPTILDEFAQTLAVMLRHHHFQDVFDRRTIKETVGETFLEPENKRRTVLHALSKHTDGESGVADAVLRTEGLRPSVDDLSWLLAELAESEAEGQQWFFARLAGAFFGFYIFDRAINFLHVGGIEPQALTTLVEAVQTSATVREFFGRALVEIELGTEEATRQRECYETAKRRQQEFEEARKRAPLLDPPPNLRVEEYLRRFEGGELQLFWSLSQTLTLEPNSRHYGQWFESDITQFPGWESADSTTRSRIINAAKRYVVYGHPENDQWVGTTSYRYAAIAGYHALFFLHRVAPEFVEILASEVWVKWAPIVTLFPLYSFDDGALPVHQYIVKKAYENAPEVVVDCLAKQIALENSDTDSNPALSSKFEGCWDERFRAFLREQAERELKPYLRQNIIRELLTHRDDATEAIAMRPMEAVLRGDTIPLEELKASVITLCQHSSSGRWAKVFWKVVSNDVRLGRTLVESACHFGSPASHLSEADTADFFIWLEQQYPHAEDPPMPRGSFVGIPERQELAQWRDGFLRDLVNRGTVTAVEQLERVAAEFPELDWMKRFVVEAKTVTRRKIWTPLEPEELFRLINELPTGVPAPEGKRSITDEDIENLVFVGTRVGDVRHLAQLLREFRDRPSAFVFFVGAGMSRPLFPSWQTALKSLMELRHERLNDDERHQELEEMFKERKYLEVADTCAVDLGEGEYRAFVAQTFGGEVAYEDIPPAYKELLGLAPQTILTTNYDGIPEAGAEGYQLFSHRHSPEAQIAVQKFEACIIRVHGTAHEPESIVFTTTEYQNTYRDSAFVGLIKAVIGMKFIVFLGFSFADPFFDQILETVFTDNRRQLHGKYALLEGSSKAYFESMERRYGLSIVPYTKSDDAHPEVLEFIRLLRLVRR